ncbi:hypothetical protein Goklo_028602 [Gossypium klotzschianum]|uniref:Zinc knuckle CX2CX4HX4C domain-containing protein n=1 Tax=Gossypium klotzschianum TaxID=34286 RepID=A0A7J8U227_9ROSI|nr:hypothetical protein [Gossypium klotzschianum]
MLVGGRGHLTIVYCWSINWIKEKIRRMLISILQTFGVQVHDLSPGLTSKGLARSLGNIIGQFLDHNIQSKRNFLSNYMRIRVWLDIWEPIMWKKMRHQREECFEVGFSYEYVPIMCYVCRAIEHSEVNCVQKLDMSEGGLAMVRDGGCVDKEILAMDMEALKKQLRICNTLLLDPITGSVQRDVTFVVGATLANISNQIKSYDNE